MEKISGIDVIEVFEKKYGPMSPSNRDKNENDFRSYTMHYNTAIIKKLRDIAQEKRVSLKRIFNEAIALYLLTEEKTIEPEVEIKQKDIVDVIAPISNEIITSNDAVKKELSDVKSKLDAVLTIFGNRLN